MPNKALLMVLDGWGLNKDYPGNAITQAKTPFFDQLWQERPTAVLEAAGESVGLPQGQMGTSEVNHFTIGAGRVLFQDLVRINKAIADESFYQVPAFVQAFEHVQQYDSALHIIGLASEGGVHSHLTHLVALVEAAKRHQLQQVYLHVITDGRDTPPKSGIRFIEKLENELKRIGLGEIVTVVGRYYAMDRDHNWDRTDLAFHAYTKAEGTEYSSAAKAIEASYHQEVTDEYIKPAIIVGSDGQPVVVKNNDAVIMANFRNDRPRQITQRFLDSQLQNVYYVTMGRYHPNYPVAVGFEPEEMHVSLGQVIADAGLRQLRITETEKFAHMTFFINCKREAAFEGEDRYMLDSYSDIPTHDYRPEMRALDIAQAIVDDIKSGDHEVIFTNICNPDMVGHTGNIPAAIKACETVDQALAMIVPVALEHGFDIIITADHGNADEMLDEETSAMITSHSLNPVPMIVVSNNYQEIKRKSGTLIDIAPTILTFLGLDIPDEMTGESFV